VKGGGGGRGEREVDDNGGGGKMKGGRGASWVCKNEVAGGARQKIRRKES